MLAKRNGMEYNSAKHNASRIIHIEKEGKRKKLGEFLDKEDDKQIVFRAVKQMVRKNKDVEGGGCVKDVEGKIVVEEGKCRETWRVYFEKLSNEEFE